MTDKSAAINLTLMGQRIQKLFFGCITLFTSIQALCVYSISIFLATAFNKIPLAGDPDFWWHLRIGKEIWSKGNFENTITYTCTNYLWSNHSWLSSTLMWVLFDNLGILYLSMFYLLIVFLTIIMWYLLLLSILKLNGLGIKKIFIKYGLFGCFASSYYLLLPSFIENRPQIIGAFLFSILANLIIRFVYPQSLSDRMNRLDLPKSLIVSVLLLGIVWVNGHGSFLLGFVLFGIIIVYLAIKTIISAYNDHTTSLKFAFQNLIKVCILLITYFISGLINTFWGKMYLDNILNSNDELTRANISEWRSLDFHLGFDIGYALLWLALLLISVFSKRKNILHFLIFIPFIILSFSTYRYILFSIGVLLVFLYFELVGMWKDRLSGFYGYAKDIFSPHVVLLYKFIIVAILVPITLFTFTSSTISSIVQAVEYSNNNAPIKAHEYPYEAVQYLKERPELEFKKLFNYYGWGGYISYTYPERKIFIDGRMPHWKCDNTKDTAFAQYLDLERGNSRWKKLIDQNNIELVLMPTNSRGLIARLETSKDWRMIFKDDIAVMYQKN